MRQILMALGGVACFAFLGNANAHGTTPLKVEESIVIDAPPEAVWAIVGDFGKAEKWMPMVARSIAQGGNTVGASRELTLKSGAVIIEELKEYDAGNMRLKYRVNAVDPIATLPVNGVLNASLTVEANGGGSKVIWNSGRFYRSWQRQDTPPPDQSDKAAESAMTALFKDSLAHLKDIATKHD